MRLFKRILVGVIVGVLLSVLIPKVQGAHAWSVTVDPAGECFELANLDFVNPFSSSNDTQVSFEDWISQAINGKSATFNANWDINLSDPNTSYVLIGDNLSNYSFVWEDGTSAQINFNQIANDRRLVFPAGTNQVSIVNRNIVPSDPYFDEYPNTWDLSGAVTTQGITTITNINSVQCLHKAHNIFYDPAYTGKSDYADYDDSIRYSVNCDTLDIVCQIGRIFNGVVNTFKSVGEAIVNGFAFLFLPDPDILLEKFNETLDLFEGQLGFLLWPFEYFLDLFDSANGTDCLPSCSVTMPGTLFGGELTIDPHFLEQQMPTFFVFAQNMIRATIIIGLAGLLQNKHMKMLKGGA